MTKKNVSRIVVVATKSRPWLIACGTLVSDDAARDRVTLANARCAVYFDAETRSLFGLASHGPGAASRVSRRCKSVTIGGIEMVADAEPAAIAAWEAEPWR